MTRFKTTNPNLTMKSLMNLSLGAIVLALASCASTTPKAQFTQSATSVITQADKTKASVTSSDSKMLDNDRQRLAEKIEKSIRDTAGPSQGKGASYQVEVAISRYEKGNAFARAMLAGLGQIHIDGTVTVRKLPGGAKVSQFSINKTFAWGGIYGGITDMDTIEDTYAKAVANAVCGK